MTLQRMLAGLATTLALAGPVAAENPYLSVGWSTDFTKSSVDLGEIQSGGPGKDGIPAITDPTFIAVGSEDRLAPREPVITVEIDGETPRAYPVRYLMWHEIVNDVVGDVPVAVTFCPLCNSGITFDRRVGDAVLEFGVSGNLRKSDMVMYDRQTESWWQQALGEGIVGAYTGTVLDTLPTWMESWAQFSARNPDGLVMDEPDIARRYGQNPYRRYDSADRPFLYMGEDPPHGISPLARVVKVGDRAWPLDRVSALGEVTEAGVKISWAAGLASALDTRDIGQGRDVGMIRVRDGAGNNVVHDVMFAFAFHAFHPDGEWMIGQ